MRLVLFLLTVAFVASVGYFVTLIARGYRLDSNKLTFGPHGLLVATSVPDGAQILINGELKSATNDTMSLAPNTYDVQIRKDGYIPWYKRLTIKEEEVVKVNAYLFPSAPSLSALTSTGVLKPDVSPDGTKIAYGIPSKKEEADLKTGIWIMELADLPLGFSREPRQITNVAPENATWRFSPDSRQILLTTSTGNYVLPVGSMTTQASLVNLTTDRLATTLGEWKKEEDKKLQSNIDKLPKEMQDIFSRKVKNIKYSPDEDKILYTASASAQISESLIPQLPGSSTQKQDRDIKQDKTYIYDIKEDRNFLIDDNSKDTVIGYTQAGEVKRRIAWFPTSNHLVLAELDKITILDYDGTNRQIVWATPYEPPYTIPSPNTQQLLILTSLGAGNGTASNLYGLKLR